MSNNLINLLLQAQIDNTSVDIIKKQIDNISKNAKPIKINLEVDSKTLNFIGSINKQLSESFKPSEMNLKGINQSLDKLSVTTKKAKDEQESLFKVVQDVAISNTETSRTIDAYNTKTGELINTTNTITTNFKKQREEQATLIGTYKELAKSQLSTTDVSSVLSKHYGDLEVRGKSLNLTTGQYSVTLKQSAKENLVLKGTVDQVTGALHVQNQTVVQARNVQLGFWEQMKIALERVPKVYGDVKLSLINWETPNVKARTTHNKQGFILCSCND